MILNFKEVPYELCAKEKIILINEAIKNITSSLFDEEMMNLSADMTVLENILKQDGLVQDDMDINSLNQILKQQEEAYVKEEK